MISWVKRKPQLFCFMVSLLCVLPMIFLTPPFQVPDEPQHFYRAFQISEGHFLPETAHKIVGGMLPSSLIELTSLYLGSRAIHAERQITKQSLTTLADGFRMSLYPDKLEFIDFSGAAFYSPIPYIPQALAIATGRSLNLGPLALMYLARFANALVAIFLLSLAVRYSPILKPAFMTAGLLPMSLYLYASLSPDALVIESAFLFTALALLSYMERKWVSAHLIIAIFCAVTFCSIKVVYAPLLLIGLAPILKKDRQAYALRTQAALIIIPIAITAVWLHAVSGLIVPVKIGTNVTAQMLHVVSHPLLFLRAAIHGFLWNGFYFFTTIGVLGWLNLKLPLISYIVPIIAFAISTFSFSQVKTFRSNAVFLWWGFLAVSCLGLVMLALYLYWTEVAGIVVEGVQGRYFIPALPLFAVVMAGIMSIFKRPLPATETLIFVGVLMLTEAFLTFFTVLQALWQY